MDASGRSDSLPPEIGEPFRSAGTEFGMVVVDVNGAASLLAISESAVLKRIKAGQLSAQKVAGRWQVFLPESDSDGTERNAGPEFRNRIPLNRKTGTPETDSVPVVSEAARAQLAAIRDEFVAPLVDRIQAQAEEIGALKAERDALWSRLEHLEAEQDAAVAQNNAPGATEPVRPGAHALAAWWNRLMRLFAGG
jgi:hypothetical protein